MIRNIEREFRKENLEIHLGLKGGGLSAKMKWRILVDKRNKGNKNIKFTL